MAPRSRPAEERFWDMVDKSGGPEACWLWKGSLNPGGYGSIQCGPTGAKRRVLAHRFSWELHSGVPLPPILRGGKGGGLVVCHRCDNPSCVNPRHLWVGSQVENQADCVAKVRKPRGSRNGNSVLTEDLVLSIRRRAAAGEKQKHLAAEYGVGMTTVSTVVRRETWGWLADHSDTASAT